MGHRLAEMLLSRTAPAIIHNSAYANTLTNLIPDLYAGLDVVSRELVGFIPSVQRDATAERAAVGQSVVWPIVPAQDAFDIAPAMATPEPNDLVVGNNSITITKSRGTEFGWTGEEQRGLSSGVGYLSIQADAFAQGLRRLTNEIERDLAVEAAANASRAYGVAGTTPFAGDKLTDTAQIKKILDDNGAPISGRSLVIDTSAGANLRSMYNLTRLNESGTQMVLSDGALIDIHGFWIKESAGVVSHTKGTATGATTNATGYAVGVTTLTLAEAGTGTIVAGDTIKFAGDANQYQVITGNTDVSAGGTVEIAAPGIRLAIPTSATAITVSAAASGAPTVQSVAFSSDAIRLAARAPARPEQGDNRIEELMLVDPRSGLAFEVSLWPGYRKIRAEVAIAWGVKAIKREHIALLLG